MSKLKFFVGLTVKWYLTPTQKYRHTSNVMFVFLTQNQKNKKRGDIEAIARRCSLKKVLLEMSQNSQENTCAKVSFLMKLRAWKCFF